RRIRPEPLEHTLERRLDPQRDLSRSSHVMSVGPTSNASAAKLSTTSRIRPCSSTRRGGRVRRVALGRDPRVPVVVGGGGGLDVDALEPGALARRLVEETVDRDEAGRSHDDEGRSALDRARQGARDGTDRRPCERVDQEGGNPTDPARMAESETAGATSEGAGPSLRV